MAKPKTDKVAETPADETATTNIGTKPGEPINPAIDPTKTAEERMAALTQQNEEQAARQARGEEPD